MKYCGFNGYGSAGYQPEGVEKISATTASVNRPPDAVESMLVHKKSTDVIPSFPTNYREVMYRYWDAMTQLLSEIMEITAISLNLPHDYFKQAYADPESVLRLGFYPAKSSSSLKEGQLRYGEHTDFTGFTILRQDQVSGLQVKFPSGNWIDCLPVKNSFVVNAGDMIQVWTNDIFKSNLHRVVNSAVEMNRLSIVFFTGPHGDTLIECLPGCSSEQNPKKYAPIKSGDHLLSKLQASNTK
eukprot:TRINITY_DN987_c0_g1_i1.p1 TRINITY_DN987_c0_g1~~TRINITY_DN987_c0_g1_i1.p1  ORF type:complete len:241 (-),score=21.45 TRINITY_DN987_c0_g1_i1:67-789(-)